MRIILIALAFLTACGPTSYLWIVAKDATRAVAKAKAANAAEFAPYEYWGAETYLHMAREKAAYADYGLARKYGRLAVELADKGYEIAAARGGGTAAAETTKSPKPIPKPTPKPTTAEAVP